MLWLLWYRIYKLFKNCANFGPPCVTHHDEIACVLFGTSQVSESSAAAGNISGSASWVVELLLISRDENDDENILWPCTEIMADVICMLIHINWSIAPLRDVCPAFHSPLYKVTGTCQLFPPVSWLDGHARSGRRPLKRRHVGHLWHICVNCAWSVPDDVIVWTGLATRRWSCRMDSERQRDRQRDRN